ncbi:hypothetical protein [Staphylococcus kloosii]|uniref:Uncharacterized protein n=1 Tax=Staphylococcus kloosii TaxID=29384 RepID=A0ABQ0XKH2_9STAP|nr:hypothetical protein [Staphylococcus kloosii]AVQ34785.1 hypothetical protein C7J89_00990 [Staphylococcus kloosii]PNZ06641.1 hypothetical protein CD136_05190 [Staphylococcus kloosii]GEP81931.1 hypothetical protein SKL01_11090 [Staphylococcus kloosii]SUM50345.1 Uncharacterised protein [Staphylococcus kloosii]
MKENNFRGNNNKNKAILVSSLPIFIYFIVLSIHTIMTKDSLIATGLSIFSLIIFTTMTTILLYSYIINKKHVQDHK